jgi:protein subunit release factor B
MARARAARGTPDSSAPSERARTAPQRPLPPMRLAERLRPLLERESTFSAVRSQGAGGQNVNKVASAVHLRFDVHASSLPEAHKARLLAHPDQRLSAEGVFVVKAQSHRSQAMNREEALDRLVEWVAAAAVPPRRRIATRPTLASRRRRLESKARQSEIKRGRRPAGGD